MRLARRYATEAHIQICRDECALMPTSGWVGASLSGVPEDHLTTLLAEALRDLVLFVEHRPESATADDDVRALEDFVFVLSQASPADRTRVRHLLGDEVFAFLGWD